jgi:hypothetical protein
MGRGIHRLSKVSPGPALPDPSTPCGQATPVTALWLFRGWPAHKARGLWPSSTLLDTPRRTGLFDVFVQFEGRDFRGRCLHLEIWKEKKLKRKKILFSQFFISSIQREEDCISGNAVLTWKDGKKMGTVIVTSNRLTERRRYSLETAPPRQSWDRNQEKEPHCFPISPEKKV